MLGVFLLGYLMKFIKTVSTNALFQCTRVVTKINGRRDKQFSKYSNLSTVHIKIIKLCNKIDFSNINHDIWFVFYCGLNL